MRLPILTGLSLAALVMFSGCFGRTPPHQPNAHNNQDPQNALSVSGTNFGNLTAGISRTLYLEVGNSKDLEIENLTISGLASPFEIEGGQFPGRTGTCPAAGRFLALSNCQVAIHIPATAPAGNFSQTVSFVYFVNEHRYEHSVVVSVSIKDNGVVEAHNLDFGQVVTGDTLEKTLTFRNRNMSEKAQSVSLNITSPQFSVVNSNNCTEIKPNSDCAITVRFSPMWIGVNDSRVSFEYYLDGQRHSDWISLLGEGLTGDHIRIGGANNLTVNIPYNTKAFHEIEVENQGVLTLSGLNVPNTPNGVSIDPGSTCTPLVKLAPGAKCTYKFDLGNVTTTRVVNAGMVLNFEVGSVVKSEVFSFNISLQVVIPSGSISVRNNSNYFGVKSLKQGDRAQMTLTLERTAGQNPLTNISAKQLPANSTLAASSTCSPNGTLNAAGSTCTLVFDWGPMIQAMAINENIQIDYVVAGVPKTTTVRLQGQFILVGPTGKKIANLDVTGTDFGALSQLYATSTTVDVVVANQFGSSKIKNITLKGLPPQGPVSVHSTTCGALAAGETCKFVFTIKQPVQTISPFSQALILEYVEKGANKQKALTLKGHLNLIVPGPGPIIKNNDFGSKLISLGDFFHGDITVENPANAANDIVINSLNRTNGWQSWLGIDGVRTNCPGKTLKPGDSCVYSIKASPTRVHSGGKHSSNLILNYSEQNLAKIHNFNWEGKWAFQVKPQPPKPFQPSGIKTSPQNSAPPIVTYVEADNSDPNFSYAFRPLIKDNRAVSTYGNQLLNYIQTKLYNAHTSHVPWSIKAPGLATDPTPLLDISVDRIVDPKTGKKYVKLYHGSTSELLTGLFDTGADFIAFNKAVITALGPGFYMTLNKNEAANYACDRLRDRRSADPGLQSMILVLGIEEDALVQGKEALVDLSDVNGNSNYPNIFFRRNMGMHNQAVYYSNVKQHIKLFEILVMPDGYGMASGYDDRDGLAEGKAVPSYCTQRELQLDGQDFANLSVNHAGATGKITLTVTNKYDVPWGQNYSSDIKELKIEGLYDKGDFIAIDPNSTCLNMTLSKNNSCTFILNVTPPAKLDNYRRSLDLTYKKAGAKAKSHFAFSLRGNLDISGVGQTLNCNLSADKWNYGTQKAGPVSDTQNPFINNPLPNSCAHADQNTKVRVLRSLFDPVPDAQGQKIAIITMGAPGSGKSSSLTEAFLKIGVKKADVVIIDPDDLRSELPDYKKYTEMVSPLCPTKLRAFTNAAEVCLNAGRSLRDEALNEALNSNKNFVFDSPCVNAAYCQNLVRDAVNKGFTPYVVAVYAKKNDIVQRAQERSLRTGRYAETGFLNQTFNDVRGNFTTIADEAINAGGKAFIYDNTGNAPNIVFEKVNINDKCNAGAEACDYFIK